jgi:pimeloyl-ACP methyl ester carboxylesterase
MDAASAARYRAAEGRLWSTCGVEPLERWVAVPGHDISVRVLETGEGPAVLFLHGITTAGSMWAPLAGRLRGHRCLVLDRPGCGLSQRLPDDRVASFPTLVDVQLAVLDSLGIEQADVVGSSFGGACVLWLADLEPRRVRRIVLEGSPALAGIRAPLAIRLLAAGPIGRSSVRRRLSVRDVRWYFGQFGEGRLAARCSGPILDWSVSLANDTDTNRDDVQVLQSIASWRRFRSDRLYDPARLAGLSQPTLWLWGNDDPIATVGQGRAWAAGMRSSTFEILDAGHLPWLDDPDLHARRIEAFLDAGDPQG